MTERPKTFAILLNEGGYWVEWAQWREIKMSVERHRVHAVMFEDGSVWDVVNGWRSGEADVEFLREIFKKQAKECNKNG